MVLNKFSKLLLMEKMDKTANIHSSLNRNSEAGQEPPVYSICICNYNMEDTIERSLSSLMEQLDSRYEVVIVDDGSSDNSVEVIKKLEKQYKALRLIALKRDRRRKLGFTRNISIQEARGEFVLLHLDCDDVFGPYINDFVEVFHRLEKCLGRQVLVSGQHINMANREFLLSHGPYLNMYRGEDRNLWNRMSSIGAYIPLDHVDFITRLPKTRTVRFKKTLKDTYDHMKNDFRGGTSFWRYIGYEIKKRKQYSWRLLAFRLALLCPTRIMSWFDEPLPLKDKLITHEAFAEYRDGMQGTYPEIMQRHGGDPDLSFLKGNAREIFS